MAYETIVILTGAGISAESGLQTFRAADGLWCGHKVEDVATPEAYLRNPGRVQDFYNMRRAQLKDVKPNAAHVAIAELAEKFPGQVVLVTQNVDDLHQRAVAVASPSSSYRFYNMHGELKKVRCLHTEQIFDWQDDITEASLCECCQKTKSLRPHIVWFGEMPIFMDEIYEALDRADLFISIGTSGNVYPAAGFVQHLARRGNAHTVELNLEQSIGSQYFDERRFGPATKIVPEFVKELLASSF